MRWNCLPCLFICSYEELEMNGYTGPYPYCGGPIGGGYGWGWNYGFGEGFRSYHNGYVPPCCAYYGNCGPCAGYYSGWY